jgi:hypothetical protein
MVLKPVVPALVAAVLLVAGGAAWADEYRPDEFFSLDLSRAVLSPKRLGPPNEFAPVAVEARSEVNNDRSSEAGWARNALRTEPKKVAVEEVRVTHPHHATAKPRETVKGAARTRLVHRHGNPLNAQAMDTRIQKWPCKTGGGICGWK